MMNPTLYMSPPTTLTCWSCCCAVPPPAPCSSPASPLEPPAPLDDDPGSPFPSGGARSDMPRAVSLAMNLGACDEAGRGGRAEAEDGGGARRRGRRNPGTLIDERATGSVSPRARSEVASVAVDRSTRVERSIDTRIEGRFYFKRGATRRGHFGGERGQKSSAFADRGFPNPDFSRIGKNLTKPRRQCRSGPRCLFSARQHGIVSTATALTPGGVALGRTPRRPLALVPRPRRFPSSDGDNVQAG